MNRPVIKLGKFEISEKSRCFVIAEVGHNHQGNMETAKKLADEAASAGVQSYKLQKRNNKRLYTREMYDKPYENENSFGATYGEHREFLEFNRDQYLEIKAYVEAKGMVFFSTAFDFESVEFLESIDVPAYKIASGDITNLPLLELTAQTKKPIIMSTGASTLEDVRLAYETVRKYNDKIVILQCTACYPVTNYREINLNAISLFQKEFPDVLVGYSGHDNGIMFAAAAYMTGARVVEKHFTLNRAMKGTDHKYSLEPVGMKKMVRDLDRLYDALHDDGKIIYPTERSAREKMGKSIVLSKDVPAGTVISRSNIGFKSPGSGISPNQLDKVLGLKTNKPLSEEHILKWEDLVTNDSLRPVASQKGK